MADLGGFSVAVVGSGLIGQSLAILFARAGLPVSMYDTIFSPGGVPSCQAQSRVHTSVRDKLDQLHAENQLHGKSPDQILPLLQTRSSLEEAVKDADFIQECVFEDVQVKKSVFDSIDKVCKKSAIIASSTSCIMPSILSEGLRNRSNALVAHPINPPLYLKLVEIIPAPWTSPEVVSRTRGLLEYIGQKPVVLSREVDGFAVNRIQYAIINCCWRMVSDGVLTVADADTVMKEALGARYAFFGPFETMHLNAPGGIRDYMERYSAGMRRVSADDGGGDSLIQYTPGEVSAIAEQMEAILPVDAIRGRLADREICLRQLGRLKLSL